MLGVLRLDIMTEVELELELDLEEDLELVLDLEEDLEEDVEEEEEEEEGLLAEPNSLLMASAKPAPPPKPPRIPTLFVAGVTPFLTFKPSDGCIPVF